QEEQRLPESPHSLLPGLQLQPIDRLDMLRTDLGGVEAEAANGGDDVSCIGAVWAVLNVVAGPEVSGLRQPDGERALRGRAAERVNHEVSAGEAQRIGDGA